MAGYRVAVIDADRQRLSRKSLRESEPDIPVRKVDTPAQITKELNALRSNCDFIIADGPKGDDKVSIALLLSADVALIPLMPSGLDLWSTIEDEGELIASVHETRRKRKKPKLKVYSVQNGIVTRTKIARDLEKLVPLLEHRGMPPLQTRISRGQSFVNATFTKTVVFRMKDAAVRSKREIQDLFVELLVERLCFVGRRTFTSQTATKRRRVANG